MSKSRDEEINFDLTYRDAVDILRIVRQSEFCTALELEFDGSRISLTRSPAGAASARPAVRETRAPDPKRSAGETVSAEEDARYVKVVAPMLGTFFASPNPSAPTFVRPGDTVAPADTVCLIEVMKLFTSIPAGAMGKVVRVLVETGSLVESGQTLLLIDPG